MTAKYSTNDTNASQWLSDRRLVLATWTTKPFHGVHHRHETVQHRLVLEYTHDVGVDVHREARSDDSEKIDDDWQLVESIEVCDYGAFHDRRPVARWFDD